MKKVLSIFAATILIFLFSTIAFAGTWQQLGTNWKYIKDDGTYAKSEWVLDNAKWYKFNDQELMLANQWVEGLYYLGADGAMLVNTLTPDGYWVGADGKWNSSIPQSSGTKGAANSYNSYSSGAASSKTSSVASSTRSSAASGSSGSYYIGNANSMKFHRPSCASVKKMAEYNKVYLDSRDEAISCGYIPCKNCRP